jgi:uncharacterized protein (TIGR00369 family)
VTTHADALDAVSRWIETSPYSAALGVEVAELDPERVRLRLPYQDSNSNPGKALHGGVAASLCAMGGQAVSRIALGPASGPWHTCGLQVNYLSAAIGEPVVAEARLLRRGKELCFVEVDVATEGGKAIAHSTGMVRGRFGAAEAQRATVPPDHGEADPGVMGPHIGQIPFIGGRGVRVEHMAGGTSRLVMPGGEANADADGGVHEGAVLALLDTTGAMASWAECGPGAYKASTPAMQAQVVGVPPVADLVAYGRCVQRDHEIFFSQVDVATAAEGALVARGTVIYRILT